LSGNVIAGKFWHDPEKLANEIAAGARDPEWTLATPLFGYPSGQENDAERAVRAGSRSSAHFLNSTPETGERCRSLSRASGSTRGRWSSTRAAKCSGKRSAAGISGRQKHSGRDFRLELRQSAVAHREIKAACALKSIDLRQ
jgi:hypothetical protein